MKTLTKEFIVKDDATAISIGSGGLEVLSTPSLIAWMENVSYTLCEPLTQAVETTVGIEIVMKHLSPTSVGKIVKIDAEITDRNENILSFSLSASVDGKVISTANHKRAIVNKELFFKKINE